MKTKIIRHLRKSSLIDKFLSRPTPPWTVLACDMFLATIFSFAVFFFGRNPQAVDMQSFAYSFWFKGLVCSCIFLVSFLTVRPYKSIVRMSVIEDTYRIAVSVLMAFALSIILDIIMFAATKVHYLGLWDVIIASVFVFASMVVVRITVKYIVGVFNARDTGRTRVVLLGSALNSISLAQAFRDEDHGTFEPVALLSLKYQKIDGKIGGLPVLSFEPEKVGEQFAALQAGVLMFLSTQIDVIRQYADAFLKNNIRLVMINQIEEFSLETVDGTKPSKHVQDIRIEDLLGREVIDTANPKTAESIRGKVLMVTGAAGSIGSEIVRQIAALGPATLILLDQAETPLHDLQLEIEKKHPGLDIKLCIADITNHARIERIFADYRPQTVYHAAAYKHVPMMERNPSEAVMTNVFGTRHLADMSIKYGTERFVMISTDKAVNPTNIMGASKRIAEIYVQSVANHVKSGDKEQHTRFITTRFGNVLGSNGSVIPLFRKQIEAGGPVTVTHRDIIRYFMTIPEACSLVLEAATMGSGGEIFIFDMGQPVRIFNLAERMISLSGLRPHIDIKIEEIGLRPGEKLYEELLNDRELTRPTHHKKIMIANVRTYNYVEVMAHLDKLLQALDNLDQRMIVAEMKRLVPEFKSQNSTWCEVDKDINDKDTVHELNKNNN